MKNRLFLLVMLLNVISLNFVFAQNGEENMSQPKQYLVKLLGTRDNWPNNMTPEEEKIMSEHFLYLKKLTHDHQVVTAGPVFDPIFGLIILDVDSEEEAREIMDNEPSAVQGVHTYEMSEMRVSLLRDYTPNDRFVQNPIDKVLKKEVIVSASIDEIWNAWTTTEGVRSFFSPNADVDFRIGGKFEILFDTNAPYGSQGSEYCRYLSYLPHKMISFEWNAPPSFGALRDIHTIVVLSFNPVDSKQIKVTLSHHGWGEGEDWQGVYDYFDNAWSYVLSNFQKRFQDGPLNWE